MSEHDEKGEERVEDLDVPESESEDVKGGLLSSTDQIAFKQGLKINKVQQKFSWGRKDTPGGGSFGDGSV